MSKRFVRFALSGLSACLIVGVAGGVVAAAPHSNQGKKPPAISFLKLRLDSHVVVVGEDVTGTVRLLSRSGHAWVPVEGATLSVRVDGTEVATVTTDADGKAPVSVTADTEGDHVVKVVYAGDDTHKRAQAAQGFEALPAG